MATDFKKLDKEPEARFKGIRELANSISDKSMSKSEIRQCAESIELLADTNWIKSMNIAMENFKKGKFITKEEFMNSKAYD